MFTGLVEAVGRIVEITPRRGSSRVGVASPLPVARMSVAVDGVCLTVVQRRGDRFFADVVAETLRLTTLARARPGTHVNLERAMCLGDRMGGHLVQGHVDATSEVSGIRKSGDDYRIQVALVPEISRFLALKGSVALQGVSLTVAAVGPSSFEVAVVPETLARTTLGALRKGHPVNVEVDLLARYLDRLMNESGSGPSTGGPRRSTG